MTLTPHPLLVPRSWKGRAIPLLPLWAVRPVQSLSACTRVHFTFTFTRISWNIWRIPRKPSKRTASLWTFRTQSRSAAHFTGIFGIFYVDYVDLVWDKAYTLEGENQREQGMNDNSCEWKQMVTRNCCRLIRIISVFHGHVNRDKMDLHDWTKMFLVSWHRKENGFEQQQNIALC
jgi:hypothetical protein